MQLTKAWRKHHSFAHTCCVCKQKLSFGHLSYTVCCQQFYYNSLLKVYRVQSIAMRTPGYNFRPSILKRCMETMRMDDDQEFLMISDPIYWQVLSTLEFDKVCKFVLGLSITNRTKVVLPPEKADFFYKRTLEAPLNYGSIQSRSCGKATLIRQVAFGKRSVLSMRGMIVPDATLRPNEIRLPSHIIKKFHCQNQWIILNRMPSLQPGNFVGLKVIYPGWDYDCFGIPLEIVQAMNADFDGDECNLYLVPNVLSQAECATILNSESQMGCFVMQGPKLTPSQDMLVAYYLKFNEIDFLPYKHKNLYTTFQVLYDIYGSQKAFECIDKLRQFYLEVLQDQICFALTLEEMEYLYKIGRGSMEDFEKKARTSQGCLVTQVLSGAKGSMEHLYQMFGSVGYQNDTYIQHSFWEGLSPSEAVKHAKVATDALSKTCKIWEPGYSYSKMVFNLQGLHVDYKGCLVDGELVVENDILNVLHYTDVMSEEAFKHLIEKTLLAK